MKKQVVILFASFFLPYITLADDFIGKSAFSPDINFNFKINETYTINTKVESVYSATGQENGNWIQSYDGTDFQLFLTRRLNPFQRIAAGYQLGLDPEGSHSHRLIQQFTWRSRATGFTPGNRLRLDQTFSEDRPIRVRLRYRFSAEIPLQGEVLDPREFFLLTSGEAIISTQEDTQDLETRLVMQTGYLIKAGQKLQLGIDFRSRASQEFINNNLLIKLGLAITL
ncbi:MAG: DUF2490 domain-containing protein [Bacteroidota bacterium]